MLQTLIMENFYCHCLLGFLLLSFLSANFLAISATTNITSDQSALLALRAHLMEPHQILSKNWSAGYPVCEWIGVTCGSRHRRVTALNISNMGLSGLIPPHLGNLSFLVSLDMSRNDFHGELPHEFAGLRRLKVVDLGLNNLTGDFPPWIGAFHELEYLSLRNNSFTGLLPSSISNMTKLGTLLLSYNFLQGNIPKETFNISSLEMIILLGNSLSGSVPDYMCHQLQRLKRLSLSANKLNGQIPSSLAQCSELQVLSLSLNRFTGSIPKEIGNLKKLEGLALGTNELTGEIPKGIGNLTMLKILDIETNNITGVVPREVSNLYNLEELSLGYNELTGIVPIEIFNLSMITLISLSGNQLSGNLPSRIGYGLPNLNKIYLSTNSFGGPIPGSISNCSKLQIIELSVNNFTGYIPNSLGNLRLLEWLDLHDNNLMNEPSFPEMSFITSLTNCKYLTVLVLGTNPLNGFLPVSIGNLSTSLQLIYAGECQIKGSIPDGIGNLSSLIQLDLAKNQLTGLLPNTIKDLLNLQELYLGMNNLSRVTLDYFCGFQNLGLLSVGHNQILGFIPECLGNVTSLRYLYLNSNRLNSTVPSNIWNLKDVLELNLSSNSLTGPLPPEINNLKMATWVDLSMNNFSGGIPSTFGEMQNLNYLFLAHNRLQGSIPESFGKMLSLAILDLSYNNLSGSIPKSLENLQYLRFFDVSFNNLRGEIPFGGPFTNFTGESFISNGALCGDQRFHVPPCPSIPSHRSRSKKVHRTIFILLGVIIGMGALSFGFIYLRYLRKHEVPNGAGSSQVVTQERISYYKLLQATDRYSENNLLGTGSFGSVYKGTLEDGRVLAIKVFNLELEGAFKSFDAECEVLRNVRHQNLTKVISSCSNPDFKALVLEFMPNGSLEKCLYSHNYILDVMQRLDTMIDVACALQYLHCDYATPVVHCDLKPSNVLLDEAMVAHVSDFGIAKLLDQEHSVTYTKTLATIGYLAPEYGSEGLVSTKCDVYSFGIMMMEVFTRTKPNDERFVENQSLKSWVKDSMPNRLAHIIDANLLRPSDEYFVEKLDCISSIMKVALNCTMESPRERTNIQDVLIALKKIKLQLQQCVDGPKGI